MKPKLYELVNETKVYHWIPVYNNDYTHCGYLDDFIEQWNDIPNYFFVLQIEVLEHLESTLINDDNATIRIKQQIVPSKIYQISLNHLYIGCINDNTHRNNNEMIIIFDKDNVNNLYIKYKLYADCYLLHLKNVKSIIYDNVFCQLLFQTENFEQMTLSDWEKFK